MSKVKSTGWVWKRKYNTTKDGYLCYEKHCLGVAPSILIRLWTDYQEELAERTARSVPVTFDTTFNTGNTADRYTFVLLRCEVEDYAKVLPMYVCGA